MEVFCPGICHCGIYGIVLKSFSSLVAPKVVNGNFSCCQKFCQNGNISFLVVISSTVFFIEISWKWQSPIPVPNNSSGTIDKNISYVCPSTICAVLCSCQKQSWCWIVMALGAFFLYRGCVIISWIFLWREENVHLNFPLQRSCGSNFPLSTS